MQWHFLSRWRDFRGCYRSCGCLLSYGTTWLLKAEMLSSLQVKTGAMCTFLSTVSAGGRGEHSALSLPWNPCVCRKSGSNVSSSLPVLLVSSLLLPRVNMYWFCDIEPCSSCTITGYSKDGTYHHIRSLFRTGKECAQFPFTVLKFHGKLPEAKKGPNVTLGKPIVI